MEPLAVKITNEIESFNETIPAQRSYKEKKKISYPVVEYIYVGFDKQSRNGRFHRNNLAAPLFSLVATATKASSLPIPESRVVLKRSDRDSCLLLT